MSVFSSCMESGVVDRSNPLLESWDTPFNIPPFERIKPDHYVEAFDVAISEQQAEIEVIVSDDTGVTFEDVVVALDCSGGRLSDLGNMFEMCEMAISDEDWVRVSEVVKPRLSMAMDSVWMNAKLFERVQLLYNNRANLDINSVEKRLLERTYSRFVRGGAELPSDKKSRLMAINSRLATLSSRFAANLIADSDAKILELGVKDLDGLGNDQKRLMSEEAKRRKLDKRWVVTLNPASMVPFLTYSSRRDLREEIYRAYLKRGANGNEYDNREIVVEMTALRQERALMLGYANHAEYVISEQMAGSAAAAYELLDSAWEPALKRAINERDKLQTLLEQEYSDATLESWDWWYYAEKSRVAEVDTDDEKLRPFFSADGVRVGAFTLANRLYGITFRPTFVPLYDSNCVAYEVLDRDREHLGVLYLDLYARPNKSYGAWCGNLREQHYLQSGERVSPVVAITCNFSPPSGVVPSLLSLEQVETLFHEFGHALHFLFQDVKYRSMSAERVEGDFVEFPSQVMENWALAPEVLRLYASHYRSNVVMDDNTMSKISTIQRMNQGFETLSYLSAALLDIELQMTTNLDGFDLEQFEERVLREKRGLIREIEPKYHLPYFAHPFVYDYSAGYYFYLWSEVLDKDCFETFRMSGDLFSRGLAEKLRREVLQRGSELSGRDLYRAFKGSDPDREPMLRAKGLIEIEEVAVEPEPAVELESAVEPEPESESEVESEEMPVVKVEQAYIGGDEKKNRTKKRLSKKRYEGDAKDEIKTDENK